MSKITESSSNYNDLETKPTQDLLPGINAEDKTVAIAVEKELSNIGKFIDVAYNKMKLGGRLFYICLLYTSPSPRDRQKSRMPSSA